MEDRWGIIATWAMAQDAVKLSYKRLQSSDRASCIVEEAIIMVEDCPSYNSVGYGGLPNEDGIVELDAGFMDGDTLSIGAIGGIKGFKNPISIARKLSQNRLNNFLVCDGAEEFAEKNAFKRQNMLTEESKKIWEERSHKDKTPSGHDTIGIVCLDKLGSMVAATSTSGLFMKKRGRIGDSPIPGSGFYVDSQIGGAAATGVGEDIMKGCLSYEAVRLMKEGFTPQEAAQKAVYQLNSTLLYRRGIIGPISLIAMDNQSRWGIGTNVEFSFVVATNHDKPTVYVAKPENDNVNYTEASEEWLKAYKAKVIK